MGYRHRQRKARFRVFLRAFGGRHVAVLDRERTLPGRGRSHPPMGPEPSPDRDLAFREGDASILGSVEPSPDRDLPLTRSVSTPPWIAICPSQKAAYPSLHRPMAFSDRDLSLAGRRDPDPGMATAIPPRLRTHPPIGIDPFPDRDLSFQEGRVSICRSRSRLRGSRRLLPRIVEYGSSAPAFS